MVELKITSERMNWSRMENYLSSNRIQTDQVMQNMRISRSFVREFYLFSYRQGICCKRSRQPFHLILSLSSLLTFSAFFSVVLQSFLSSCMRIRPFFIESDLSSVFLSLCSVLLWDSQKEELYLRCFIKFLQADSLYSLKRTTATMIRLIIATLVLCAFALQQSSALNATEYIAYIDELSQDEKFVEEYAKWSFKLFSQPDYLYGAKNRKFPCPAAKDTTVPTSVHRLRPSDIKCVGAMGDSLTAALGAHAITPIGLLFENRGSSLSASNPISL